MRDQLLTIIFFLLLGCSNPKSLIKKALENEKNQKYDVSEQNYLKVIIKYSTSEYVAEAKYRLGLLYKDVKKDYLQARIWFAQVVNQHKETDFAKLSDVAILESPDYLGALDHNKVVLGDVDTFGKNMKVVSEFKKLDYDLYECNFKLYAGEQLVRQEKRYYFKKSGEIREYSENPKISKTKNLSFTILLKQPIEVGNQWMTIKENKEVLYKIVETNLKVKLKKFEFEDCIKVLEEYKGVPGVKYLYYAPNKGCIKITTSSLKDLKQEYPVLELVEYLKGVNNYEKI